MSLAVQLEEKYTYGDYLNWPEGERWELIDGVPYDMSPAPSRWHQHVSMDLSYLLRRQLKGKPCQGFHAPFDVRLPEGDESDDEIETVVQPDLVVVCDENKLDDRGCRGAPDLVIEILSDSTAAKDLHEKLLLYERHEVKEYWIVDLWSRAVSVHVLEDKRRFGKMEAYGMGDTLVSKAVPGLKIDLNELFAELPRERR